jgi:hypothetical protein
MTAPQAFAALPLEAQLEQLAALLPQQDARELLLLCAEIRDHAPLAWLSGKLLSAGWLAAPPNQAWFAGFLVERPEVAVDKILRAVIEAHRRSPEDGGVLCATLLTALDVVSLSALPVMCLIDRALKQSFPEEWDRYIADLVDACDETLRSADGSTLSLERLAQIPARAMGRLRETAAARGPEALAAFDAARVRLAREAIEVLGNAPKGVSQSNAEELLSRRVYTDPGHFLVELLQNAEDAGAKNWRLVCEAKRIVVWHDGTPFDTKDLVGVTSIGQTTKRKQQIGFFGVGFKSVYEITDRPRIYSDVYEFEIADVSIPKSLGSRPPDLPRDGTVLVLPLRHPTDTTRSPRALFEKACALDPVVLFTLRQIEVIEVELSASAGGPARHAIRETIAPGTSWSMIHQEPAGWNRAYLLQDDEYQYDGGVREPGKADRTRVMVGVRIDDDGVPRPLPPAACTVYSYLPTEEHGGLRFFVQGHFDVPVDRERITQDSAWNRWLLSKVPRELARLASKLFSGAEAARRTALARGFLDILPLPRELAAPVFRRITLGLSAAFRDLPLVPCTDGELRCPTAVTVTPATIAALFEAEPAATPSGPRHFVDLALDARGIEVARSLGCGELAVDGLVDLLEQVLAAQPKGTLPTDPAAPIFLRAPTVERMSRLYDVLLQELEKLDRELDKLATARLLARLRELPLVLGSTGRLHRPGSEPGPVRGTPQLRAIYEGLRTFVPLELDAPASENEGRGARAATFLDRLGVGRLEALHVVEELEVALLGRVGPSGLETPETALLSSRDRLALILELLGESPHGLRARARRLPLFEATDGRLYPVAQDPTDLGGVVDSGTGPLSDSLLALYQSRRPILARREHETAERFRVPPLGLEALVADLGRRPPLFRLTPDDVRQLHAFLDETSEEIPPRLREGLARLPIWPDRSGVLRPLVGEAAALVPKFEAICTLFPGAPFLDAEILGQRHVMRMGGEPVGAEAVIAALAPEAQPPLRIEPEPRAVREVLAFLLEHADGAGGSARKRLTTLPAFLSDQDQVCSLADLCLPSSPELRALYGGYPGRHFLAPESLSLKVIRKWGMEPALRCADAVALVEDLAALADALHGERPDARSLPLVQGPEHLKGLLAYLAGEAPLLARATLAKTLALPIYPDEDGRLGALEAENHLRVRPCEEDLRPIFRAAGVRLLGVEVQRLLRPLLEAAGVPATGVEGLVHLLAALPAGATGDASASPLHSPECLPLIQEALMRRRDELARHFPVSSRDGLEPGSPVLSALHVWRTVDGHIGRADRVVDAQEILALAEPGSPERALLEAVQPCEEDRERLEVLSPLFRRSPVHRYVADLLRRRCRPGEPLERQPSFLHTLDKVARVRRVLLGAPADGETPLPLVDAEGRLRVEPLRRADRATLDLLRGTSLFADLVHPDFLALLLDQEQDRFPILSPLEIVDALQASGCSRIEEHPLLSDASRRQHLYRWLREQEHAVFADRECREKLRQSRIFLSSRGTLLSPEELVWDRDLPDLGIDWSPHAEIPAETLDLLARHLGVGRPKMEDLVAGHVLPAYRAATARNDADAAGCLLHYLATQLDGHGPAQLRLLVQPPGSLPLLVEDAGGAFRPVEELLLPVGDIAPHVAAIFGPSYPRPSTIRFSEATLRFLVKLGLPQTPPLSWIKRAMSERLTAEAALSLAALCGTLYRGASAERAAELTDELPLRHAAWIPDRTSCLRRASELYLWKPEVEAVIGDFPELYPHPGVPALLGDELCHRLGFRGTRDIRVEEVVHHIEVRAGAGTLVPFRVYQWLEEGLVQKWLDAGALAGLLGTRPWVCTDDGQYFNHRQVLGVRALHLFGGHRGYWERGRAECPGSRPGIPSGMGTPSPTWPPG